MNRFIYLAMLVTACGLNEEKFEDQYAEAFCGWLEDCAKLSAQHGTMESCITAEKIFADETLTPDECEFNKDEAKECLEEIAENDDCVIEDAIPRECLAVSTCTGQDTGQ